MVVKDVVVTGLESMLALISVPVCVVVSDVESVFFSPPENVELFPKVYTFFE